MVWIPTVSIAQPAVLQGHLSEFMEAIRREATQYSVDSAGIAQLDSGMQAISASSERLAWTSTMEEAGLRHGDVVTAIACVLPQIYSTQSAFAALKSDGSVVTWGDPAVGGDSSAVAQQVCSAATQ